MISSAMTVPAYLRELSDERRAALQALRQEIRKAAPAAKETMKYGLPHYDWGGPLFALASQKQYFCLYVEETNVVRAHRAGLAGLSVGKCCIRFRRPDQVPMGVVRKILRDTVKARRVRLSASAKSPRGSSTEPGTVRQRMG